MENELPSTSIPSSSPPPSIPLPTTNGAEENYSGDDPSLEKTISITLSPGSSLIVSGGDENGNGIRRPLRQVSIGSTSSSSSSSSSSSRPRKKPLLQKQKKSSAERRIKCVLVGDSKVGKSALVRSFLYGQSSNVSEYVPTLQDTHMYTSRSTAKDGEAAENRDENGSSGMEESMKKKEITLQICDTGGQEEMDRLRPLCYSQAQMVIICFSVMNPTSFANVSMKWLPEVRRHCMVTENPESPLKLLLVGTQSDLRSNVNLLLKLMDDGLAPISETQALRLAHKIGALKYVESSSITHKQHWKFVKFKTQFYLNLTSHAHSVMFGA